MQKARFLVGRPAAKLHIAPVNGAIQMNLFKIREKGKTGFIDATGQVVISPRFESANDFAEGRAWASIETGGKTLSGFIDESGEWAIEPQFFGHQKSIFGGSYFFRDGRSLIYTSDNRPAFIDHEGNIVSATDYEQLYPFSEERALVVRDGLWAFIQPDGTEIIPFRYSAERLGPLSHLQNRFSEGLALVPFAEDEYGPNLGFIDRNGETVLEPQFTDGTAFSEGLAMVRDQASLLDYFFIDRDDYLAFDRTSQLLTRFAGGLADMLDGETQLIGYVDQKGEWSIPPRFSDSGAFSEDRACVRTPASRKLYGYIDPTGEPVIPFQFETALAFQGGLASVKNKGRLAYINRSGESVWRESK